uniref:Uncharacterized protein n=1 Tax=Anguilla anguilla TaxID=7936 RepID=A0A0E9VNY0_ANGAN
MELQPLFAQTQTCFSSHAEFISPEQNSSHLGYSLQGTPCSRSKGSGSETD